MVGIKDRTSGNHVIDDCLRTKQNAVRTLSWNSLVRGSNLACMSTADGKSHRQGRVWARNYGKTMDVAKDVFDAEPSAAFICADMGSSPNSFHCSTLVPCVTVARAEAHRLWLFSRDGKMAELSTIALGLLQGFSRAEQRKMRVHLRDVQLRQCFGNAMCKPIAVEIVTKCMDLLA